MPMPMPNPLPAPPSEKGPLIPPGTNKITVSPDSSESSPIIPSPPNLESTWPSGLIPGFVPNPSSGPVQWPTPIPWGGGNMPMPSPAVGRAQIPLSIPPPPGSMAPVLKFNGYGEFSGLLYHSPHSVVYEDDLYPTALHLYEARKFLDHRPDLAEQIRQCENVEEITAMSAQLAEFTRRDWGNIALVTMDDVLYLKFRQHGDLRTLLLGTFPADLVYVESGDPFWGDGAGVGMNELGKSLMRVRERLRDPSYSLNPSLPEEEQNGDPSSLSNSSNTVNVNAAHLSQMQTTHSQAEEIIKSPPSSVDKSEALFAMYLDRADEDDKKITQRWKGECDAILIFTGLFSAALAALLAVSVQGLQPGPQDSSAFYLRNIYYLLANSTSSQPVILPIPSDPPKFSPPKSAILVNSLWFLSLVMSLTGALLAVFIQQWAQSYLEATQGRHSPKERARIRVFHAEGLENLYLNRVTRAVPILIHISLFLFFSGLPIFLSNVNRTVFNVVVTWLALCVAGYACFTLMPIFCKNSPYYSPLSSSIWWCVTNALFIIYKLLKNFISRDSTVFRWYDKHYARPHFPWPSLRAMQKAAGRFALDMPPDIDYRALLWLFQTLNEDEEFEQFFDALPSLCESEALADAQSALIKPNEEILSHALIGMMDRTLLSELVSEEVKQRRIIICTKAVGATSLLGPGWTLQRVLCGEWHGFSRSIHFGLCVQDWENISHPLLAFYAQCAVAVTLTNVQDRDDHWFRLASRQLNESKSLLRNYFADDDSILLVDAIFIIRRTMEAFSRSNDHRRDIREASSKTLELICSFDIKKTLANLQHQFCSLWNELVDKAEKNPDPEIRSLCIMVLKSIRRAYISLHENTPSAPTAFSTTTDDEDRVLADAMSYPRCGIDRHRHSTLFPGFQLDTLPRNVPRVTPGLMDMVSSSYTPIPVRPPRLSTPPSRVIPLAQTSPFTTVRNLPLPFIPSPNFPVAPMTGPRSVPRPYSHPAAPLPSQMIPPASRYSHPNKPTSSETDEDDAAASSLASSNDTLSTPPPSSINKARPKKARRPTYDVAPLSTGIEYPLSPLMHVSRPTSPGSTSSSRSQGSLDLAGMTPASRPGAHVRFALSESTTYSPEFPEIAMAPRSDSEEPSPSESLLHVPPVAFLAEDVTATTGEIDSQRSAHVRLAPSKSTSASSSEALEIAMEAPSGSPESSPPESPLHISPIKSSMALRGDDGPAAMGEVKSQQEGTRVRFAPSESTSTSLSESQVIDIATPSHPESPDSSTLPTTTPASAGPTSSIDASPSSPRTPRTTTVSLPGQMSMTGGGGTMPMPSPAVGEGVVAQIPMATSPLDSVLVNAKMTMPSPSLGAGGIGDMAPVLKFDGYGDFSGLLYHSPHSVVYEDDLYPTALHLYEARKFLYHRPDLAERIRQCEQVEEVTALSAELGVFARWDWGNVALSTMDDVLYLKFLQHGDLRTLLLNTYPAELVYVESEDLFWGDGAGAGMNELGKSLMRVRERLRIEGGMGSITPS